MTDHPFWILILLLGGLLGFSVALDWVRERHRREDAGEERRGDAQR